MVTKKEEKNQCRTLIITLINTLIFVVVLTHKNKQEHFRVFLGLSGIPALVTLQTSLQDLKSRSTPDRTCCLLSLPDNICLMRTSTLTGDERSCS